MSVLQNYFRQLQERGGLNLRKIRYRQHFFFKKKCKKQGGSGEMQERLLFNFRASRNLQLSTSNPSPRKICNLKSNQIVREIYGPCKSQKGRVPYYTINAPQSKLKLRLSSLSAVIRSIYCIIGHSTFRLFCQPQKFPTSSCYLAQILLEQW